MRRQSRARNGVVARRRRSIPEREEKTLNGNFRMCDRAANARATRRVAPAPDSMRAKEECRKGFVEVSRKRRARGSAREACGRRGVGSSHRANGETGSRFQSPLTTFLTKRRRRIMETLRKFLKSVRTDPGSVNSKIGSFERIGSFFTRFGNFWKLIGEVETGRNFLNLVLKGRCISRKVARARAG